MSAPTGYLLDADSFIRSKREHYAFDFCPGYWDALLRGFRQKRVCSITPIRKELAKGKDALANWIKHDVPDAFFEAVIDVTLQAAYAKVMQFVQDNNQYSVAAKQKFASGADPWLVAFANDKGYVLVTYEVSSPDSKSIIKLPDVAAEFDVDCIPPYVMLRQLQVKLTLAKQNRP